MFTRWVAMGAAALVVGACGGRVARSSGEDEDATGGEVDAGGAPDGSGGGDAGDGTPSGGAAGGGGANGGTASGGAASGGGGASGGAASGGAPNPADCPAQPPVNDTACSFGGGECHYVTAGKSCCEETADATCVDGRWSLRETDCDCPETCPVGLVLCAGVCTDVMSDPENCGACGAACPVSTCGGCGVCVDAGPAICSSGICTSTCVSGLAPCGVSCVDPCTNQIHCGGCDRPCEPGFMCFDGSCTCPPGQVDCSGECVAVDTDPEHCGGCGVTCPAGEACVGGSCGEPDWNVCEANEDCQIVPATCCGACGAYTSYNVIAMHRDALAAYTEAACAGVEGCPACAATQQPSITARCAAGRCEVVDLSEDDLTACTEATDCVLRTQACCECDAPSEYVAIGSAMGSAYAELVCVEGQGCLDCEHEYPASPVATCDAGHCLISF